MVLALPKPGAPFARPSSTTSLSQPTAPVPDTKLPAVANTRNPETTKAASSSTLNGALASYSSLPRNLGGTLRGSTTHVERPSGPSRPNKVHPWLPRETEEEARERQELNNGIAVLARLFPDVKIEVFRELLVRFDGDSRLRVCADQLLRYPAEHIRGRWRAQNDPTESSVPGDEAKGEGQESGGARNAPHIPLEERFRSKEYKVAARMLLAQEFRYLSENSIEEALADVNYSYIRARPAVRHLSGSSWRSTFGSFFHLRKKRMRRTNDGPPNLVWEDGEAIPSLQGTGCEELDNEIYDAFVAPGVAEREEEQLTGDLRMAEELNDIEATNAGALYECCCCVADVTFEQIATCSTSSHVACFTCIQRTMHQAVFGQGWTQSVDSSKSTLQCLAPLPNGTCDGILDCNLVKRAVLTDKAGSEIYRKFEDRLAEQDLLNSELKLIRCPFCSYAEVDPIYHPSSEGIAWQLRRDNLRHTIPLGIFLFDFLPFLAFLSLVFILFYPVSLSSVFSTSLRNLSLRKRSRRFVCSNPSCGRQSCLTCQKFWQDPHACHEGLFLSLRKTVEAARTEAIKRTCPRCGLAFVRDVGCNKMTCLCGYSMCYVCRKPLGPKPLTNRRRQWILGGEQANGPYARGALLEDDQPLDLGQAEGYRHFCEHFRANGELNCSKCTKCHLYVVENDDLVARRAGEKAEREWRIRRGLTGSAMPPELELKRSSLPGNIPNHRMKRGRQQLELFGIQWDLDAIMQFLTVDLWCDDRWKEIGQNLIDRIVETVIVVVDV